MPNYAIIQNGEVANIAVAASPLDPSWVDIDGQIAGVGYTYADGNFYAPVVPAALVNTKLTNYAFKARFTQAERIAIRTAATTNPQVYDYQDMTASSPFIDVTDPTVIADVNALVTLGLIATGRPAAILSTSVAPSEAFNG